ncbi:glutathione S-transferase family protein [Sagittula sp. SSi028]|uniref:glutathione S-transferase family protein n=1 Tax=Sagittula sp. SSi028 TaxID=3400636 RepID=UPI003AF7D7BE
MALHLYGHPDSGHACKVALALRLAGLDHQVTLIDIWAARDTRPDAFRAISPLGEVPVLTLDEDVIFQSGAILLELGERFSTLGMETPAGRRRARELVMWEGNRIGLCLPQLIEAHRPGSAGLPPEVIGWLEARYTIDCVNFSRLLGDGPFFHGAKPGVGDCAIWGYVQWLDKAQVAPTQDMARWINAMRDLDAMTSPEALFV